MNDWYNDPPEDDVPEVNCPKCGEPADFVRDEKTEAVFTCTACGHEFVVEYPKECLLPDSDEPNPFEEDYYLPFLIAEEENGTCRHGNPVADCNDCCVESDFAYDAIRER